MGKESPANRKPEAEAEARSGQCWRERHGTHKAEDERVNLHWKVDFVFVNEESGRIARQRRLGRGWEGLAQKVHRAFAAGHSDALRGGLRFRLLGARLTRALRHR